jgi:hypothetical protein
MVCRVQAAQPLRTRQGGFRRAGSPSRSGPGSPNSMSFGLAHFWRKNLRVFACKDHALALFHDDLRWLDVATLGCSLK